MDASEDMLKLAKEKNLDAQFIHSTAENLNLNTKCDLIVCNFAFHHFEDKKTALTNIFNTLNENGIFSCFIRCFLCEALLLNPLVGF